MKVLDLAAAPGGKTTQLFSLIWTIRDSWSQMKSTRAARKFFVENVERFGAKCAGDQWVCRSSGQSFLRLLIWIVLDALCSGEGMFRKQPDAMDYWSVDYPRECSLLQREILEGYSQDVASRWFLGLFNLYLGSWGKMKRLYPGFWKTMIWSWKLSRRSMVWQRHWPSRNGAHVSSSL